MIAFTVGFLFLLIFEKVFVTGIVAGVSLRGTVEKREKESVYLKLDIDGADGKAQP